MPHDPNSPLKFLGDLNLGHEHRRSGDLMRSSTTAVEALSSIRGRSVASQFVVIHQAQNLTPLEAKTIISCVGHGAKVVFTGDPCRIDNSYADSSSNGFHFRLLSRICSAGVHPEHRAVHGLQ